MRNLASKSWCISVWRLSKTACSSLSLSALCFWQCLRQQLEFSRILTSPVGPTLKASWEEELCPTGIELLSDAKDASEEEKKTRGSRSSLLQQNRSPFPSPAHCMLDSPLQQHWPGQKLLFSWALLHQVSAFPKTRYENKIQLFKICMNWERTRDHPVVYTLMDLFSDYSIVKCSKLWDGTQRRTVIRKK